MTKNKLDNLYTEGILWNILENFYTSLRLFEKEFISYNDQINSLRKTKKLKRKNLINHLEVEEIQTLVCYKNFSNLENHLEELHKKAPIFLKNQSLRNLFWRYINNIFHELSIIKGEFYRLVDAPEFSVRDTEEYYSILREINVFLPAKLQHVSDLFKKAKEELKQVLVRYNHSSILVRSIYLFGDEVIAPFYGNCLDTFLEKIYPERGPFEAYLRASYSFHMSNFESLAKESLKKATIIKKRPSRKYLQEELFTMWDSLKAVRKNLNAESKIHNVKISHKAKSKKSLSAISK